MDAEPLGNGVQYVGKLLLQRTGFHPILDQLSVLLRLRVLIVRRHNGDRQLCRLPDPFREQRRKMGVKLDNFLGKDMPFQRRAHGRRLHDRPQPLRIEVPGQMPHERRSRMDRADGRNFLGHLRSVPGRQCLPRWAHPAGQRRP